MEGRVGGGSGSCSRIESEDVIERYVTGRLGPEEAEAFERHFFDCDRCWEEVWRATAVLSALEEMEADTGGGEPRAEEAEGTIPSAAAVPGREEFRTTDEERESTHDESRFADGDDRTTPGRWRGRKVLLPLAAAAGLVLAAIGLWQVLPDGAAPGADVYRAPEGALDVSAYTSGELLIATWGALEEAERYRARLYTADGAVLFDRTTVDTTLDVAPEELSAGPGNARLYWRIDALDPLGRVVARSGLRPVSPPAR